MRFIFLPIAFFVVITATAGDTSVLYLNARLAITASVQEAAFTARVWKQQGGWGCAVFYSGNKGLAFKGVFTDKKLTVRNGWFSFYYPASHKLQCAGYFQYNIPVGDWERWYENGQKLDSGRLHHGKVTGHWKQWYSNGQLKTAGNYTLKYEPGKEFLADIGNGYSMTEVYKALQEFPDTKEGVWMSWHPNGRLKDSVLYKENLKEGVYKAWHKNGLPEATGVYIRNKENAAWNWYYDNGRPRTVEVYEKGRVKSLVCYDTAGQQAGEFCNIHKPAVFKNGGMDGFRDYLDRNILLQDAQFAASSSGTIIVNFTVTKEGVAEEIFINGAPLASYEPHTRQVFLAMPGWHPAVYHNMATNDEVSVAIQYAGKNVAASRPKSAKSYEEENKMFNNPIIFPYYDNMRSSDIQSIGYQWW